MSQVQPDPLSIAVRVYPQPEDPDGREDEQKYARSQRTWKRPDAMLVFDTETRTDATQRLTFGSYRFVVSGRCLEEGLFYADDLPREDQRVLEQYVAERPNEKLKLLSLGEFLKKFYKVTYKGRCLLVGFNLPFDLSRLAHNVKPARGRFAGGFSLGLWTFFDKKKQEERASKHRPRIGIKQIDSKRALKGFTARDTPDDIDLIPEGSSTGKPEESYKFRGHFVDLRTVVFALTDRSYSLKSACEDFGVEHPKQPTTSHGEVTPEYIDYNRRDVLATSELAVKLLEEYDRHPINLQVTKAYSPASIGKAYLHALGIPPILERQPDFSKKYLGYAASAFFGGRTSSHIRKIAVPVVYTDFLSMYPTVNRLMDLWRFVVAEEIRVVEHCEAEIREFLTRLTADALFHPASWKQLPAFVKVIPNGDILPCRGKYSRETNDWQVGVNYLYADPNNALWYTLPDVAASVLLTGKVPEIVEAWRIEPHGTLPSLEPVKLRGNIEVDPRTEDFFKVVIEERKMLDRRSDLSKIEKERLDKALKVLANATSYGIYAQMDRQESDRKVKVICHGIDAEPFSCRVAHPDDPGEFCFPPLASLITGAARLMLALLEYCVVHELGGTYAMEDTDSMAIVATEHGGKVRCQGHTFNALSWKQVDDISKRFLVLKPYNHDAIQESVLKIEKDNRDPITRKPRQVYCLAISAKRYALFMIDENGTPVLLRASCPHCGCKNKPDATYCKNKDCNRPIRVNNEEDRWSEHGLGHLLNPTDPEGEDREWIAQDWENIIRRALGIPTERVIFEKSPAVGRTTVSSPAVIRPLAKLNEGKRYGDQIKPFNFLLSCHVKAFGHPAGTDLEHFHLITPYESDSRHWLTMKWIDQYSGKSYRIITKGHHGTQNTARVKTHEDVLVEYEFHPESKCADASGKPAGKQTVGLLQRRHIRVDQIKYIGKESNSLEEVESGLIHAEQSVYTEYPDPRRNMWQTKILSILRRIPLNLLVKACKTKLSRRALIDLRAGRSRPQPRNEQMLSQVLEKFISQR